MLDLDDDEMTGGIGNGNAYNREMMEQKRGGRMSLLPLAIA